MNELILTGLKAHHPLGFLAACGLLRCLTVSEQEGLSDPQRVEFGPVKLGWRSDDRKERVAVLFSELSIDVPAIVNEVAYVAKKQKRSSSWTWSKKIDGKDGRPKYREVARAAVTKLLDRKTTRRDVDMLAASASDLVGDKDRLRSTAFDLTSANQGLLNRLVAVAGSIETNTKVQVKEALLGPWQYQDEDHSLGWDPQTQRLHALRWKAPTNDTAGRSVRAAVFLASVGLPLFPCFAAGGKLRTTAFHSHEHAEWFAWPVWGEAVSLATLRSLVSHPVNCNLRQRGVRVVYRSRVAPTGGSRGNYRIFGHPEEWLPVARV
jgi:hypothetical protein